MSGKKQVIVKAVNVISILLSQKLAFGIVNKSESRNGFSTVRKLNSIGMNKKVKKYDEKKLLQIDY